MEDPKVSAKYVKGFNDGYTLSKHEPEIMAELLKSNIADPEYKGALEAGKRQHEKEMLVEQMKQKTQNKGQSKDKGKGI